MGHDAISGAVYPEVSLRTKVRRLGKVNVIDMKKILTMILIFVLVLAFGSVTAFAAGEEELSQFSFPKPKAPNYFVYTDGDAGEGQHDDMQMIMVADPEVAALAAEYDRDSDAFYEKYGIYSFTISMQYDVQIVKH